ncbi:MAG: LysR family transcriptional regulator [Hyphomicrobium sp.]|jgi:DNA-binding transcriptional LysR family regulator
MNFKALRAFQLIAERGSLAAAASDLCLSPPAVSRLIALLEDELELRLFNRTGRGLSTTQEGRLFYDATKQILAGLEEIPRIAKDIQAGDRHFQLLTTARMAQAVVSPALALLRHDNARLRCRVDVLTRDDADHQFTMRQFDLAITSLPVAHALGAVEAKPLFKVRLEAVLPKSHRLATRNQLNAADLANEELIGPWQDQVWRQQMQAFLPAGGVPVKYAVETRSSLMACQMASDGAGIAIFDRLSGRGLDLGGVVFRPLEPATWVEFGYVHRRGEALSENAVGFISAVRRAIEEFRNSDPENAAAVIPAN